MITLQIPNRKRLKLIPKILEIATFASRISGCAQYMMVLILRNFFAFLIFTELRIPRIKTETLNGNCPVNQLHKKASSLVKAASQSAIMEVIEEKLTEEEHNIYRRGRNAHSPTMAKHATMADYRRATGFEALMGYLYLKGDYTRMLELVRMGIGEDRL